MKNLFTLFSLLILMACKEEKPKKIVFDTNHKCLKQKEYKVGNAHLIIKVDSSKIKIIKKIG